MSGCFDKMIHARFYAVFDRVVSPKLPTELAHDELQYPPGAIQERAKT